MARYIDADAMSIYFDALIKHAETEGLYNMAHVYERCLRIVKDAPTADVAPRAEWISVEERLPDGNGRFLTVDEKGNMMTCYFGGRLGWFASVCDKNAITHWMPLPELPEMKGE